MDRAKPAAASASTQVDSAKLAARLKSLPYSFSQQMPAPQKKSQFEREYPQLARPPPTPPSLSEMVQTAPSASATSANSATPNPAYQKDAQRNVLLAKYANVMSPPSYTPTPPPPSNSTGSRAALASSASGHDRPVQPAAPDRSNVGETAGSNSRLQGMWDPKVRQKSAKEQEDLASKHYGRASRALDEDQADLAFLSRLIPTTSVTPRPARQTGIGRKANTRQVAPASQGPVDTPTAPAQTRLRTVAPPPLPTVTAAKDRSSVSLPEKVISPRPREPPPRPKRDIHAKQASTPYVETESSTLPPTAAEKKSLTPRSVQPPSADQPARRVPTSPVNSRAAGFRDAIKMSNNKERDSARSIRRASGGEMPEAMLARVVAPAKIEQPPSITHDSPQETDALGNDSQAAFRESQVFNEDDLCTFFLPAGLDDEVGERLDSVPFDAKGAVNYFQ